MFKRLQSVLDSFTPPLRLFFTCCFHREKRIQKRALSAPLSFTVY
ncbi:hypothetical protein bas62_0137 [Escherichia phage JohannJBalmer]|nr:hypothetical protein bas62_0137 [Escherichia phage JohannJBalmer]